MRRAYGVRPTLGLIPGRVTFIMNLNGVIKHIFSSQFNPRKHVSEAIKVLKSISSEKEQTGSMSKD